MKFVALSALSLLISVVSAFHIVPPASITACDPLTVSYDTTSGIAPFSLSFRTASADGTVLALFTGISGISYTWDQVSIPPGTSIVIVLGDARGLGSATPVMVVGQGASQACLGNSTSIPLIPSVTSTSPPTSTVTSSPSVSTSLLFPPVSTSSLTTLVSPTLSTTTSVSTSLSTTTSVVSDLSSISSQLSSSISSVSSVISSASSLLSSLTSSPRPTATATSGLGTSGAIANTAGVFTIGAITAIVAVLLA